jgi:hypothetical protein
MEKYRIPQIGRPADTRVFSLVEAESLLPDVQKLTRRAVIELEPIQLSYRKHLNCDPRKSQLALDYERIVRSWIGHMQRLGLIVRGL